MHLQLAIDVGDNGKHTITVTNLMPGGSSETEAEDLDKDEVADELVGVVADYASDHDFDLSDEDEDEEE